MIADEDYTCINHYAIEILHKQSTNCSVDPKEDFGLGDQDFGQRILAKIDPKI